MLKDLDITVIIVPEIKGIYSGASECVSCLYEGCGEDDGWPKKQL